MHVYVECWQRQIELGMLREDLVKFVGPLSWANQANPDRPRKLIGKERKKGKFI